MKKTPNYLVSFLKWLVVILAAGNLAALFLFDYRVPGFLRFSSASTSESEMPEAETEPAAALQISVPSQPLSYDGAGNLDLMDSVVIRDNSGIEQSDADVFSAIKAGSTRTEKIIEYSVTDEAGNRITAERKLRLDSSYTGPRIEILGEMPDMAEEELPLLVSTLISQNLIQADDGFGNDITASVTSSVKSQADASDDCIVTLSVVNMLNDTYSTDVVVHTQLSGPVLKLTTDKVTLNVGDSFSFYQYIAAAQDEEGNGLYENISMNGSVDTSVPGEYVLEFYCTDSSGVTSPVKTLTVTVK